MGAINHDLTQIETVIIAFDRCLAADSLSIGHDGMPVCSAGMADINAIAMALSAGLKVIIVDGCGCDGLCRCMSWAGAFSVVPKGNPGLAPARQPQSVICLCGEADDMLMMRGRGLLCCPADAAIDVRASAAYVSHCDAGSGCVRDVIEQILRSQGRWEECKRKLLEHKSHVG